MRTMISAWEYAPTPFLDDFAEKQMFMAKVRLKPEKLREVFLKAYWPTDSDENGHSENPQGREQERGHEHKGIDERQNIALIERHFSRFFYLWLAVTCKTSTKKEMEEASQVLGLDLFAYSRYLRERGRKEGAISVLSVRPTVRVRPDGRSKVELLVMLNQSATIPVTDQSGEEVLAANGKPTVFPYRGGTTLLIDPQTGHVRYSICKRLKLEETSLRKQRNLNYMCEQIDLLGAKASQLLRLRPINEKELYDREPLACLHKDCDRREWS